MDLTHSEYSDGFFNISSKYGFLPMRHPYEVLPDTYKLLQEMLSNLPYILERKEIESEIKSLPNYTEEINKETDKYLLAALYRGYCFLTSGYLLEPAHHGRDKNSGKYGSARQRLPKNLAEPFDLVANKLDVYPFLDYHYAYSLGNYTVKDKNKPLTWDNLGMAVSFSTTKDECGFIMLHVDINTHSPELVRSIEMTQQGKIKEGLTLNYKTMKTINERRQEMWRASDSKRYNDFRTYIMGITGNEKIFGKDGVWYGDDPTPRKYRGQTGAQDDIIPTEDIFSGVIDYYPENELTRYLLDLRSYRPKCVQQFHKDLYKQPKVFTLAKKEGEEALVSLLGIVNEIYCFRHGHWMFVQRYIMANTKHATATGGTPIISWIPNQILAVLMYMKDILECLDKSTNTLVLSLRESFDGRIEVLTKQMKSVKIEVNPEVLYQESLSIQKCDEDVTNSKK